MNTGALESSRTALPSTPHPAWISAMLGELRGPWERACWPRLFVRTRQGAHPSITAWRRTVSEFFVIAEAFPKYVGLSLSKTTYGKREGDVAIRRWLLRNIVAQARLTEWYLEWMRAMGVDPDISSKIQHGTEVAELHDHCWRSCAVGTLAEGIAATNYALEGVTGVWARGVLEPFREYAEDGVVIDERTLMWLKVQARWNDARGHEAIEAIKLLVDPADERQQREIARSARRSLDLFARGIERCFDEVMGPAPSTRRTVRDGGDD